MRTRSFVSPLLLVLIFFLGAGSAQGQALGTARTGPVINGAGPVFDVVDPDFPTPTGVIKAVWEVAEAAESPDVRNRRLESVARFLNMHARAGVPRENLKLAVVVHGPAGKDLLGQDEYRARYGVENPNYEMIQELLGFGVQVILCGQTQMGRGLPRDELAEGVQVALSAMTALVSLQSQGYRLIPF